MARMTAEQAAAYSKAYNESRSSGASKEESISAGNRAIGVSTGGTTNTSRPNSSLLSRQNLAVSKPLSSINNLKSYRENQQRTSVDRAGDIVDSAESLRHQRKLLQDEKAARSQVWENGIYMGEDKKTAAEYDSKISDIQRQLKAAESNERNARFQENEAKGAEYANMKNNVDFSLYAGIGQGMGYKDNGGYSVSGNKVNFANEYRDVIEKEYAAPHIVHRYSGTNNLWNLTPDEKQTYYYILAKQGEDKADEFLDWMQDSLNYRSAEGIASDIEKDSGASRVAREVAAGLVSGNTSALAGLSQILQSDARATTTDEFLQQMIQQNIAKRTGTENGGYSLEGIASSAANTIGNMIPSMSIGMLNPVAGAITMGLSTKGNTYKQILDEGYSKEQAEAVSIPTGIAEGALQYAIGGISSLGGKATNYAVERTIARISNGLGRSLARLGISNLGEITEELLQNKIGTVLRNGILGENNSLSWNEDDWDTVLMTIVTTTLLNAPSAIGSSLSGGQNVQVLNQQSTEQTSLQNDAAPQNTQHSAYDIPGNIQTPPAVQNATTVDSQRFNAQVNNASEVQNNTAPASETGTRPISMEDYADSNSPVWNNLAYDDTASQQKAMQDAHDRMIIEGKIVEVPEITIQKTSESFPDLRSMKKSERTPILKQKMADVKASLRQFLSGLKGANFEFEVNGNVLEARLYDTGIKEVLEKVTQEKANMLSHSDQIFKNSEYLYSLPDYDSDPNVYRWNYFYTPVRIGNTVVGVRIAVRDMATPAESQIYNWGIKKSPSLGGGSQEINSLSSDASSVGEISASLDGAGRLPNVGSIPSGVSSETPEVSPSISSIPNSGQNVNGNVLETGDIVPTQTHGSDSLYTESERIIEGLRPEDSVHVRHSDASVDQEATRRYNADAAGEKTDLFESGEAWTDADTALAHRFLSEAVEKARESGDYSEVVKMQREWERQGTTTGQALRQRGRFINTPENIVAESAAVIYGDKETTRKLRPKQKAEIMDNVVKYANEYNKIQKGDTTSVINMIKRMNEVRKTTGLLSSTTSKQMSWALEVASKYPDGETFLRDVLATQIRSIAGDYARPSTLNQIKQIRFNNMLSKLGTIVRNLGSNNVLDPMEAISSNIAIPLDMFLSKFTGTRSVALDAWFFSKAKRQGTAEGFVKSYIQVGLDADIGDVSSKYEQSKGRTFKMTGNFFERFLSTWEKYENYGLKTTDEAQKGGIRAQAQRGIDALKAKGEISEDALSDRAQDIALDRTLQKEGVTAKALLGIRRGLNYVGVKDKQGGELGAGDILAPFAMVPANATAKAIQYTPFGLVETSTRLGQVLYNAKNGTLTPEMQAEFVTSVGRSLNAIGLVALSTALALKGFIVVAGDDDKDKEASEKTQGISGTRINVSAMLRWLRGGDSSIRNGDTFIDIGYLQQLNTSIIMGAAIADAYKEDGSFSIGEIANANAEALLQSITELPAMSTLANMIDSYNHSNAENTGGKLWDAATGFAAETATSFVIPNALRGIATGTDNKVRNTYTADTRFGQAVDSAKAGIPFLRQTLPVSVDNWGKDKEYTGNAFLNFMNSNILPGQITHYKTNAIMDELGRLSDSGIDNLYPNRYAPNAVRIGNETVQLTSEQRETFQRTYGSLVDSYYNEFINSSSYGMLTDDQRAEVFKNLEALATDRAKVGLENSEGSKYDSSLDDESSLSDIPAYYSYSAIMRDAADKKPTTDWQSVMKMMQNFSSLPDDVKTALKGKSDMHLKAVEYATNNGLSPEDWYSTYDVIKDAKVSTGSEAQLVSAIAINGTNKNLSDSDKLMMLQSQLPLAKDGSIPTIVRRYDVAMNRYGISFDEWTKFETSLKEAGSTGKWTIRSVAQSVGVNPDNAVKIYKTLYDDPKYTAQVNEEFLYLNPVDESGEVEPMSFTEYYNSFNDDQEPQQSHMNVQQEVPSYIKALANLQLANSTPVMKIPDYNTIMSMVK